MVLIQRLRGPDCLEVTFMTKLVETSLRTLLILGRSATKMNSKYNTSDCLPGH
jgi:hypothetical protein